MRKILKCNKYLFCLEKYSCALFRVTMCQVWRMCHQIKTNNSIGDVPYSVGSVRLFSRVDLMGDINACYVTE